ncbi:DUF4142 domain-containing protein [Chitinophaga qingshengii]|uniref:DUF4142 domain-containing protein n=1 Tax=Chitinophaga qingshengii TaxID=1569794 RepID=A0ABR7TKV8_9BACT|nr:DUF4142 domain-containing protein [Chitinophaga qingshengii]MBC9930059.1 DUF4142 domain-containing protein [Chitinophaga qingshengii]
MKKLCIPVLALMLMACGQQHKPEQERVGDSTRTGRTNVEPVDERSFLGRMANSDLKEIKLGELASQHAKDARVKKFGEDIVKERTASTLQLQEIAHRQGLTLAPELSRDDQDEIGLLRERDDMDRMYIKRMVHEQKRTADRLAQYTNAKDTAISSYAKRMLPIVNARGDEANKILEDMRKQMNNRDISHD